MGLLNSAQNLLQNIGFQNAGGVMPGSLTPADRYNPAQYKTASPSGVPASSYNYGPGTPYNAPPPSSPIQQNTNLNPVQAQTYQSPAAAANSPEAQQVMEAPPPPPTFEENYGSFFDEALNNLNAREQQRKGEFEQDQSLIQNQLAATKGDVSGQLQQVQNQLSSEEQKSKGIADEQANEQRRMLAETKQGLLARYGTSTPVGLSAGEIASRTVFGNIGKIRQGFAQTIADIGQTRTSAIFEANKRITEADLMSQQLISDAKKQLNQDLTAIANSKTNVAMDRINMQKQALDTYQQTLTDVNTRNANFRQNIYMKQLEFDNNVKLKELASLRNYSNDLNAQLNAVMQVIPRIQQAGLEASYAIPTQEGGKFTISTKKKTDENSNSIEDLSKNNY